MRSITLPSGAVLKVAPAPFAVSKNLWQALLREIRGVAMQGSLDVGSFLKDFFCVGFSSLEVEAALNECLKRCTYDGGKGDLKIDDHTFEPVSARQDYVQVSLEVAKENIAPFAKSLFAEYRTNLATMVGATPQ
jgi:hypothetical protein